MTNKQLENEIIKALDIDANIDWTFSETSPEEEFKELKKFVKRLFKEKVVKDMVSEKLKEIMSQKGIDKGFVLDTILKAIDIAEEKQDVSNMLRAAENFVEMLEMKPNKKVTTDTLQIDMTNQIMDQIETEEKKMVASRKTEELTNESE